MRSEAAFEFIPELMGDAAEVVDLIGNPPLLYIDTAINTLHMGSKVFSLVEETINTKQKKETKENLLEQYKALDSKRLRNYEEEVVKKIDNEYLMVKEEIKNGEIKGEAIKALVSSIEKALLKISEIYEEINEIPDFPEREKIDEMFRKTLRAYKNLLKIQVEEEFVDGQDKLE